MKKPCLIALIAALIPLSTTASESNFYGRLDTGYSWSRDAGKEVDDNVNSSALFGAGIGYRFNNNLRADITGSYRGGYNVNASIPVAGSILDVDTDISSVVGLANLYYDIGTFDRFTPYVGAGIGFSRNKVDTTNLSLSGTSIGSIDSHTNTSFAWQLGAGTAINISSNVSLDVGYRYMDMGQAQTGDNAVVSGSPISGATTKGRLTANEIQAGLRIAF